MLFSRVLRLLASWAGGCILVDAADVHPGTDSCSKLAASLRNRVFLPGTLNYTSLNTDRWSGTSVLAPGCIVTPATAQEVSTVVRILVHDGTPWSIKSGGHNPNPEFNNIDNGVTIDLRLLNEATVSADKTSVTLGGGTTMAQAYAALADQEIAFPGGVCDGVGIGGISTGGGQSFFMPKVGWFVDNILRYEVVLASGAVVNASQKSHNDLYRALKGGSTNFGIVTKVEVAAFPNGGLWGGQIVIPATNETTQQLLSDFTDFTTANNDDVDAAIMVLGKYAADGSRLLDIGLAATNGTEDPPILAPFLALQPQLMNTVTHKPLASFVHEVSLTTPDGYREVTATMTFTNDLETLRQVQAATDAIYEQIRDEVPTLDWMFSYNPQPRVITTHAMARGGNSLGLQNVEHDQTLFWLVPRYADPASDAIVRAAVAQWVDEVTAITAKLGTSDPFLYVNHANSFQKPLCATGESNLNFLKMVAGNYDPRGVFQRLVPGGHKLSTKC